MKLWNLIISFSSWKSQWFREIVHNQKIGQKSIIPIWLVVSNVNVIFHFIYGMSSFPLTNSIIFQDGFCITNQPWITPQKIRKNHQKIQTNKKITRKSRKNPEKTKKNTKIPWRIPWSRSSWSFRLAEAKKRAFWSHNCSEKLWENMWFNVV